MIKGSAVFVVTADQKRSRSGPDRVPAILAELAELVAAAGQPRGSGRRKARALAFERTAGDEVQGLVKEPSLVVDVLVVLLREGWWVGIGIGDVEHPLPESARAGRGPAYVAARQAVEAAKSSPAGVCIAGGEVADQAEAAAWLLASLLARRTPQGWQVVDLVARGAKGVEVASKLAISPQAVSSRLRVAGWAEEQRGRRLLTWLLARAQDPSAGPSREEAR